MIFYFTATGNSLYAAKYLEEERISIPQIIDKEHLEFQADRIGIVCPVYGHEVPQMVQDFLAKASFETDYFYMVLTYGNRHGGAAELAWKLCRKCGIQPDYINVLMMVDNWLPSFDMNEQRAIDKKVDDHLEVIKKEIEGRVHKISEVTDTDRAAHQQFLENQSKLPADLWQHLITVGEGCVGCGLCEQVCPSGSIRVEQGKAVHIPGQCQTCLACVHHCPQKAVGLTVPEKNPEARYRNEKIALKEIVAANSRKGGSTEEA